MRLSEFGQNRQRSQRQKWVNVFTTATVPKIIIIGKYLEKLASVITISGTGKIKVHISCQLGTFKSDTF